MDFFLDLRAHSHGGPVGTLKVEDGNGQLTTTTALVKAIAGREVYLMAHGYNVNRQHGMEALTNFAAGFVAGLAPGPPPVCVGILWPGDCVIPIFIDYIWEGNEAEKSGQMVGELIANHFAGAASITLASHSLGARVVLNALETMQKAATPLPVRDLILFAGAIEDDTLLKEFSKAAQGAGRITVVYSGQDKVLELAYPGGNLLGGLLERGDPNLIAALGRHGPSQPWPGKIVADPPLPPAWNFGHTDYLSDDPLSIVFPQPVNPTNPATTNPTYGGAAVGSVWKPCWTPAFTATRWLKS